MDRNNVRRTAANESELNPYAAPAPAQNAPLQPVVVSADDEPSAAVFDELKRVANYRHIRKILRGSGTGSIVFGVIAIALGAATIHINPINAILLLIGVLLTVEGVWFVISPTPIGIIIDGVSLMLVGAWNVFISIMNMAIGAGTGAFPIIGIFQIIWGLQSFGRYSRFAQMPREIPSPSTIKRIDEIAKDILRTKPAKDPQIIEFRAQTFFGGNQPWKGRLRSNHAVFVGPGGKDVIFARTSEVKFTNDSRKAGKTVKVTIQIGDRNLKGTMPFESYQRYESWKQALSGPRTIG